MTKEEIQEIVAKYRRMSDQELKYGEEKCALFDRVADQLEQDIDLYVDDDYYRYEKEIINDILEQFDEFDSSIEDDLINED